MLSSLILAAILAARLCPTFPCVIDGVRILRESDRTPRCERTRPARFEAEGEDVDEAIERAVLLVSVAGGNTFKVSNTASGPDRGVVRGYGFVCEGGDSR